ncbi:tRNA uridine(34) 5-carboxymethylaminomethyl modification radical SAM/GNAT enzyme Elp3 [Candidatus Pacearchaeota archaeon]|nr:tRNA uridine(34) 5-carboxymethylaminomethyl modification radical SAM/GNAT enzyme Elp3 [Candidatus Pacearchaeota archaeon]
MTRKPTKTISGVTPLAVVLKPMKCKHGTCLFCPTLNVPQSYTPLSPAIMRAKEIGYDPYKQVKIRLKVFKIMGHPTDKIELIVLGGTFLDYPTSYQKKFILDCYNALNNKKSKTIKEAQKLNEKSKHRCIALCLETRPDSCSKIDIKRMLELGSTRVELGVQCVDDKIYRLVKRGHTVRQVVQATQWLKDAGFKIGYHMMPGLPGSNFKKDLSMFKEIFQNEKFKPDQIKIYPTQVIAGSDLVKLYNEGRYLPYSEKELTELLLEIKKEIPRYVRIMRVMREIPPKYIVSGIHRIDLRRVLDEEMKKRKISCKCIRCREIGFAIRERKQISRELFIKTTEYRASKGREYFIEFVNKEDIIFALIRLRIPYSPFTPGINKKTLVIRELHVYGPAVELGKKEDQAFQHMGLGKKLMIEAENIAKKNKLNKIAIISGVGVRRYYRDLGYNLEGTYMVKKI